MTAAAFQGTFADFRMVRGRKVAQIIVEVPLEQAGAALEAMGGLPMPEESRWVAVARMNLPTGNKATAVGQVAGGGATEIPREKRSLEAGTANVPGSHAAPAGVAREKTPAQKAAIRCVLLCKEPAFREWLGRYALESDTEEAAAERVRELIGAKSRRDIAIEPNVFDLWSKLVDEYDLHQRYGDRR